MPTDRTGVEKNNGQDIVQKCHQVLNHVEPEGLAEKKLDNVIDLLKGTSSYYSYSIQEIGQNIIDQFSGNNIFELKNLREVLKIKDSKEKIEKVSNIPRGNSAHGVYFDEVIIKNSKLPVAIKEFNSKSSTGESLNFYERAKKALTEYINASIVIRRGFSTFIPVACLADFKDEKVLNVTLADANIFPADQLNWYRFNQKNAYSGNQENSDLYQETIKRLDGLGTLLANLHSAGIFHKDSQIKNYVVRYTGEIIPIDWEAAHIFNPNTRLSPEEFQKLSYGDLSALYSSLSRSDKGGVPVFDLSSFENKKLFLEYTFQSYTKQWKSILQQHTPRNHPYSLRRKRWKPYMKNDCLPFAEMLEEVGKNFMPNYSLDETNWIPQRRSRLLSR